MNNMTISGKSEQNQPIDFAYAMMSAESTAARLRDQECVLRETELGEILVLDTSEKIQIYE